jgi:predicted glycoside hydrolase/deacetylase ChbG (UPF0249 family)
MSSGKEIQLLIRSDDLGYSEAVNYGIAKVLEYGMTKSIGLMPNMPSAVHGIKLIQNYHTCIGQHTNICVGKPVTDPALIPSLVNQNGDFKSSSVYRGSSEDFVNLDEVIMEIKAQLNVFRKLTGQDPEYFEGHAVRSQNFIRGLQIVAEEYNLKYSSMYIPGLNGVVNSSPVHRCRLDSMNTNYDPFQTLKNEIADASTDMPNIFVCHPGYLDAYLLCYSSLTINRTKEVELLCDPNVFFWLQKQNVTLISYRDIS